MTQSLYEKFPGEGYWLVLGNQADMLVSLQHPRPIAALELQQYRRRLGEHLHQVYPHFMCPLRAQAVVGTILDALEALINEAQEHAAPPPGEEGQPREG